MQKYISDKQLKKVLKYISPDELVFQEEHWGFVPETYWERVDMWKDFLIYYFPNEKIDHFILAIILLEMQSYFNTYTRIYQRQFEIVPICNDGVNGLLKCLELFKVNFLNIESVSIKVRELHPLTSDDKPISLDHIVAKDAAIKNYRIEGKEIIHELFKIINENKDTFQKISDDEKKYFEGLYKLQRKNKPKTFLRKKFSPIIYKYLEEHLTRISHNRICYLGDFLLFTMGIMPDTQSDLSDRRKFRDYLRKKLSISYSEIEKYLKIIMTGDKLMFHLMNLRKWVLNMNSTLKGKRKPNLA